MNAQKAIVLGIHSFLDETVKVSSQYIAEGLAARGWQVDYISAPSSLFDFYGNFRRKRFARVWLRRQDKNGIPIKPGLTEYAFKTLHPTNKMFLRFKRLMDCFSWSAPRWLNYRCYEICIHDITSNVLFLPLIKSNLSILRLNDPPEGFAHDIHQQLIDHFKRCIASLSYNEIWAVSAPLARYAMRLNSENTTVVMPNGVEDKFLKPVGRDIYRHPKTAVYLGSVAQWVDLDLLEKTALLLPDWQICIYGPSDRTLSGRAPNLRQFPPIGRAEVPDLLSGFQVGLIPFRETYGRIKYVERPIKFYEYIATGLGVASTDVGSLKAGMGTLAIYGNTPYEFANAIECAAEDGKKRTSDFNRAFIKRHSWENIINRMCARILKLQGKQ